MVYESKFPRQRSASGVAEDCADDCAEDSEVTHFCERRDEGRFRQARKKKKKNNRRRGSTVCPLFKVEVSSPQPSQKGHFACRPPPGPRATSALPSEKVPGHGCASLNGSELPHARASSSSLESEWPFIVIGLQTTKFERHPFGRIW